MVEIQNLSLRQLQFPLAGIHQSPKWDQMEKTIPIEKKGECIETLARGKEPEPTIRQMIVAKRLSKIHNRQYSK